MGHANLTNISKVVNKALKKGPVTIKQIVDDLTKTGTGVHASEGTYKEPHMVAQACQDVFYFLLENSAVDVHPKSEEQAKVYREWNSDAMTNWDCGDDGNGGEYGIFDSIEWVAIKGRLPVLRHVTH